MIYLIFLDIDGTILSSEGKIHERTIEAIRKAQEAGNKVFINTGRSDGIIPPWLLEKVHPDGVVAGLGAFIRIGNEILLADVLNREMLSFAMDIADECNDTLIIEGENDSASYNGVCYLGEEHIVCGIDELFERYPNIRVSKLTYLHRLPEEAVEKLDTVFAVFNHPTYAEVGLKGYSKATGMEFLRLRYGVDNDHIIAMGDSDNDKEMLSAAGIAVAMGNALQSIKEMADFVTTDCKDGGVGYAIEKLVLEG